MNDSIGFIGLGLMGRPMAKNLLKAGFPVVVHSRSQGPVDDLVSSGALRASSPGEVARRATRIITMLPDSPDVELVVDGPEGLRFGQAGTIVIEQARCTRGYGSRPAQPRSARSCSMPVSGGGSGAISGTLDHGGW
jgi:3-hydroxyisobutyrate dehydrogenase-like beta-hydroxyacid dehydrogenase